MSEKEVAEVEDLVVGKVDQNNVPQKDVVANFGIENGVVEEENGVVEEENGVVEEENGFVEEENGVVEEDVTEKDASVNDVAEIYAAQKGVAQKGGNENSDLEIPHSASHSALDEIRQQSKTKSRLTSLFVNLGKPALKIWLGWMLDQPVSRKRHLM